MSSISHFNDHPNQRGFTLIEVLIALFILMLISMGIFQATTETFKLRDSLAIEGEFYNNIRFSMDIIQKDIAFLYTPLLFLSDDQKPKTQASPTPQSPYPAYPTPLSPTDSQALADLPGQTKYFAAALDKTGIRMARFQGSEDKMSFIAASHQRIYTDMQESEFAKISFEIEKDDRKDRDETYQETQVLVKHTSVNVFEDDEDKDQLKRKYSLLYGVKSLKFRYCKWDKDSCKWSNTWDSDTEDTKNQYPDQIEVNLEVLAPHHLSFQGLYHFRPEMPLRGLDPST